MNRFTRFTLAASLLAFAGVANAQDRADRSSFQAGEEIWANRGLVTNRMELQILTGPNSVQGLSTLSPYYNGVFGQSVGHEFGINIQRLDIRTEVFGESVHTSDVYAVWPIGFAFGPVENLEVGLALPLYLSPSDFGDLPLWATYRFVDGKVQVGARLALYMPTASRFQMQFGLPVMVSTGRIRVDTGAFIHLTFNENHVLTVINAPVRVGFQVTPELYAGFQSGLMFTVADGFFDFTLPLMGFVGYTIPTNTRSIIDVGVRTGFEHFLSAGDGAGDAIDFGNFSFAFGGTFAIQF